MKRDKTDIISDYVHVLNFLQNICKDHSILNTWNTERLRAVDM
jgi:hypothetical protein